MGGGVAVVAPRAGQLRAAAGITRYPSRGGLQCIPAARTTAAAVPRCPSRPLRLFGSQEVAARAASAAVVCRRSSPSIAASGRRRRRTTCTTKRAWHLWSVSHALTMSTTATNTTQKGCQSPLTAVVCTTGTLRGRRFQRLRAVIRWLLLWQDLHRHGRHRRLVRPRRCAVAAARAARGLGASEFLRAAAPSAQHGTKGGDEAQVGGRALRCGTFSRWMRHVAFFVLYSGVCARVCGPLCTKSRASNPARAETSHRHVRKPLMANRGAAGVHTRLHVHRERIR